MIRKAMSGIVIAAGPAAAAAPLPSGAASATVTYVSLGYIRPHNPGGYGKWAQNHNSLLAHAGASATASPITDIWK